MHEQQVPTEEQAKTNAVPKNPGAKFGLIAVVEYHSLPKGAPSDISDITPVEFLHVQTKREMVIALANPSIKAIHGVIRGKKLDFNTSRKVTFS